jgi:hypothetical protein
MDDQLPFTFTDLPSIEGYVPSFSKNDMLLQLRSKLVQVSGGDMFHGGVSDDDEEKPKYESRYSIMIDSLEIWGEYGFGGPNNIRQTDDRFTIVAKCANSFLEHKSNETAHPTVWKFLKENGEKLNQSKRYWVAVEHLQEIAAEEAKVVELQKRIARGKIVAALRAAEVLSGRAFTQEERELKWAELSGGLPYRSE